MGSWWVIEARLDIENIFGQRFSLASKSLRFQTRVIRIKNFDQGLQLKMRVIRIRNFSFRARLGNSLVKLIEVRVTLRGKKRRVVTFKKYQISKIWIMI